MASARTLVVLDVVDGGQWCQFSVQNTHVLSRARFSFLRLLGTRSVCILYHSITASFFFCYNQFPTLLLVAFVAKKGGRGSSRVDMIFVYRRYVVRGQ